MAKIEMDVSEYEAMKDKERLLKESLEKERELREEIDKLKEEKIDALKQNEKSVTIIKRTERRDEVYSPRGTSYVFTTLRNLFERGGRRINMDFYSQADKSEIEYLRDIFFEVKTTTSTPFEEVIVKGLDEVRAELRDEVFKDFEQADKEKQLTIEALNIENDKLKNKTIKELKSKNIDLKSENAALQADLEHRYNEAVDADDAIELLEWESEQIKVKLEKASEKKKRTLLNFWKS